MSLLFLVIAFSLLLNTFTSYAQEKKRIDIEQANIFEPAEEIGPNVQRMVGDVRIRHADILMWCDSAYRYTDSKKVDAFGNVHITKADTIDLYANKIYYDGDNNIAKARNNVKLINKSTTLFTDSLDFDMSNNICYYNNNGKIIDSTNTLNSVIGKFFVNQDIIHFYNNVIAQNNNYTLNSDTLIYNTTTGKITINGPSTLIDSTSNIYTENGWYDTKTGEAELLKNSVISNDDQILKADYILYNRATKKGRAQGNVWMEDFKNKIIVSGNTANYSDSLGIATVTDSALFMMYSKTDTLFLHADTLRTIPDTIQGEKKIMAYHGTRFYRADLQGLCDSMVYFTKDSVVQLFYHPIIWSENHQLSADLIEMRQKGESPDELHLIKNSFIISKLDSNKYDQIKGKNMVGYIFKNKLNNIDVNGNGQTLYYARQEKEIIGLNRVESSKISIKFKEGKIYKISFIQAPEGKLNPLFSLKEEDKTLKGFEWKIDLRPLSKYDVFKEKPLMLPQKE